MTSNTDVVDILNDLIETSKDGEHGFRASAEHAKSPALRALLTTRAGDCRSAAEQLQTQVRQLGGDPEDSGSAAGAMHRGWVAVRATLSSYDDLAIAQECERGEDAALATYREALDNELPPAIRSLVEEQYAGVKRHHDEIRQLRDGLKTAL